ncbi:hypothetical protein ABW19_dt0209826 [Dactylella cylindrospora]|nr:hypothetical protein ABW19_dt0209826 [Dactylella cylindrospora]
MAPSFGICKFCEKEQAKYKCPTCSTPYCSLACYKPHKTKHDEEKDSQPAPGPIATSEPPSSNDAQETSMDAASSAHSAPEPVTERKKDDFDALLKSEPLVSAIQNNANLKTRLLDIYNCTQKLAFEAENARLIAQNAQFNRQRGRGRGGRHHFHRKPMDWTIERGMNRGLRKIQAMRKGGKDENVDIEEWSQAVLSILEGGQTA